MTMDIKITFILPQNCTDEAQVSEITTQAFELCKQNVSNVTWLPEAQIDNADFSKTDFVIFPDFKGERFERLKQGKCVRILGPWCVLICLMEGRAIPNYPWPIYNVAMSNCIVSTSHLPKSIKLDIQEKVQSMGGCYTDVLRSTNTHLVTDSVQSEKYLQAAEAGVKLMLHQWIDAVWVASQTANIHSNDEQFSKYRCLPFHKLVICSTGIQNKAMRDELNKSVVSNGGAFTGSLNVSNTDILVVYGEEGSTSAKYRAARTNSNVHCVTLDWVKDSIERGYAQPYNNYGIKKKTSTPTKMDAIDPNFSTMSAIGAPLAASTLEETRRNSTFHKPGTPRISPNKRKDNHNDLIDGLDIKKAKMAGHYLDGCSVYVVGVEGEQREKLCKVLNLSGATRYDNMSERLTHVIIGDTSCAELRSIIAKNFPVSLVSLKWLVDSINNKRAVDEEPYLINLNAIDKDSGSPLGCKGLNLLRSGGILSFSESRDRTVTNMGDTRDSDIMQQYLKNGSKDQETDTLAQLLRDVEHFDTNLNLPSQSHTLNKGETEYTETISEQCSEAFELFKNDKFLLLEFNSEEYEGLREQIEISGGIVVAKSYKGIPDYIISPCFVTAGIKLVATNIVNDLWVSHSIQENEKVEICYYHIPMVVPEASPLENCVVTLSSYGGFERAFLKSLVARLGGVLQEQFSRISSAEKGILAATHLVSLEANGKKYAAALKWKLPVVNKDWLLECARTGEKAPERSFLVGDAKVSEKVPNASRTSLPKFSATNEATTSRHVAAIQTLEGVKPTNSLTPLQQTGSLDRINRTVNEKQTNESRTPVGRFSSLHEATTSSSVLDVQPESAKADQTLTPHHHNSSLNHSNTEKTPVRRRFIDAVDTPGFSQVTPVNKILEEFRQSNRVDSSNSSPDSPVARKFPFIATPTTPYGACITPNPSPGLRKEMLNYINSFPDYKPPKPRRLSTPLSELKRRCWERLGSKSEQNTQDVSVTKNHCDDELEADDPNVENHPKVNLQSKFIDTKLEQLENMLTTSNNDKRRCSRAFQSTIPAKSEEIKDSQPLTVGWDYMDQDVFEQQSRQRIFIISGVDTELRQQLVGQLEQLGATVSELATYDPACTHMVCSKPARNEKTLCCMAAGKWILHISYVEKSLAAGQFLPEEEFEFGNPKSIKNINMAFDEENELRIQSMHWWRKEIARRGYRAFNDMRAIVVANKREPLIRVIEAGGGTVVDIKPPFTTDVHATHCLMEIRCVSDSISDYVPLAKQGIYCANTLYISNFLFRVSKDVRDCIIPNLSKYYN